MNERIRQLVKEALGGEKYERIILFGSRARGDFNAQSDHDILITTRHALSLEDKIRIFGRVRRHLAQYDIDADVIVKSESEVDYLRHKLGSVVESAIEEGVPL
jgi:predicted nucleotidyltransferase